MKNFLTIVIFLIVIDSSSFACTCLPTKNATQELEQSAAVFSGKVIEIKRNEQEKDLFMRLETVFEVERAWKGTEKRIISVFTSTEATACGYEFKKGETYLLYAGRNARGMLTTSICTRTRSMKDAGDDLKELGSNNLHRAPSDADTSLPAERFLF